MNAASPTHGVRGWRAAEERGLNEEMPMMNEEDRRTSTLATSSLCILHCASRPSSAC
jgi:hypothetical protein